MPTDFCDRFHAKGVPPHAFHLKLGANVSLMRNISPKDGLVNGTPMVVRQISDRFVYCSHVSDAPGALLVPIPRVNFAFDVPKFNLSVLKRQFPLRLSY